MLPTYKINDITNIIKYDTKLNIKNFTIQESIYITQNFYM